MMTRLALSTAIVITGTTGAFAQEFAGAELGITYLIAPDADGVDRVNYFGGAELALPYNASIALDLSLYDYGFTSSTANNATLHGIYDVNSDLSVGLFYGQDTLDEIDVVFYGTEALYNFGIAEVEGYVAAADDEVTDAILLGAAGRYAIANNIIVNAKFDNLSSDDFSTTILEAGVDYTLNQGPTLGLVIGNVGIDVDGEDDSEFYFGANASIAFGPNNGTTFQRRGYFEAVQFGFGD